MSKYFWTQSSYHRGSSDSGHYPKLIWLLDQSHLERTGAVLILYVVDHQHCMGNHYPKYTPMLDLSNFTWYFFKKRFNLNSLDWFVFLGMFEKPDKVTSKVDIPCKYGNFRDHNGQQDHQIDRPHGFWSILWNRRWAFDCHYSQCHYSYLKIILSSLLLVELVQNVHWQ